MRRSSQGGCLEPLEDLARLGEQRLGVFRPALRDEPLGVLELGDGQVEDEAVLY